jgi:F0F1-type ATP synthase assembly protein I
MRPHEPFGRQLGAGYRYVSLGITFGVAIAVFMGAGLLLDRWLGVTPLLTILGTLVGAGLSFYWLYQKLRQDEEAYRAERGGPKGTGS